MSAMQKRRPRLAVTPQNVLRIAAEACRDVRTVERVLRGQGTTDLSRAAVRDAARRLAIEIPKESQ